MYLPGNLTLESVSDLKDASKMASGEKEGEVANNTMHGNTLQRLGPS